MKFHVLNDGTILSANGMQVGTITISSDRYKDDIISAIESPFTVDFYKDTKHVLEAIKPKTMNIRDIEAAVEAYGKASKFLVDLIDTIDYYK